MKVEQAVPWQQLWVPPRCQCFELCTQKDVVRLYPRLPSTVHNVSSPWYSYLKHVYGGSKVPLPFGLHQLELLYPGLLPTSTHLCQGRPIQPLNIWRTDHGPHLPDCSREYCAGWVQDTAEVARDHRSGWSFGASHLWTPISELWKGNDQVVKFHSATAPGERKVSRDYKIEDSRLGLSGRHLFVALQPGYAKRHFFDDNTWVEVIRVRMGALLAEGGTYGCWFWPVRGSGIFVNVGRSLRAANKAAAAKELGTPPHDDFFANATRARGFSSLQLKAGGPQYGGKSSRFHTKTLPMFELFLTGPGCVEDEGTELVWRSQRKLMGACVPLPTRTGWNASRPCRCSDDASPILNCRG